MSEEFDPEKFHVGIIGLGMMGSSIAVCMLMAGHPVTGVELVAGALEGAQLRLKNHFKLAKEKGTIADEEYEQLVKELAEIPEKERQILKMNDTIKQVAEKYKDAVNALYLGRGYLFPVALEGALKLKEISYIHAEGYAAGEMKHGPIALIDDNLPVVVVAPHDAYYEKIVSNIQEVKARKGNVIAIVSEGDKGLKVMANDVIEIPKSHPALAPLLSVLPLQLLAYHIAVMRGCNVDQPRNLAKSVTVE